jgi:tRNA1Val (adenine37-N6)-methyltransferase
MGPTSAKRIRSSVFKFKKFQVDQTGCAMKVSSDATLFGGLIETDGVQRILDIGTGTGLLSLMLAQRTPDSCRIDAVELDGVAFKRASQNKNQSPFSDKITVIHQNISDYRQTCFKTYDLIICNPPFFENALLSNKTTKNLARHSNTESLTFDLLVPIATQLLDPLGAFWVLIPEDLSPKLNHIATENGLFHAKQFKIRHTNEIKPNRVISCFKKKPTLLESMDLVRYDSMGFVSKEVQTILQDFMIYFPPLKKTT